MKEKTTEETESSPILDLGGEFDAKELANRIRNRVHQKMVSGFYDEKEIRRIQTLETKAPSGGQERVRLFDDVGAREEMLRGMDSNWDVTQIKDLPTPRGGAAGALVKIYKKLYKKLVHPSVKFSLVKQAEFNAQMSRYAVSLRTAIDRAEGAINELNDLRGKYLAVTERLLNAEKTMDEAEARIGRLEERGEALAGRVDSLSRALRDVDKHGIFLKRQVTRLLGELSSGTKGGALKAVEREKEKLEAFDYTLFENVHRGTREEIKNRLRVYTGWFEGAHGVLDVGCGRGELLELFREKGIEASGVDLNEEMVAECSKLGLNASSGDALEYLKSLEDGVLGGLAAVQFIEHLPVDVMTEFFRLAYDKLKPGGVIAAETINPACLTTFCGAFYLDLSHTKPIHPLAVQFLLERIGFGEVRIEYLNPYPKDIRLATLPLETDSGLEAGFVLEYNQNVEKLNNVLFSHTDYAVVAKK